MPTFKLPQTRYFQLDFEVEQFLKPDSENSQDEPKIQIVESGIPTDSLIVKEIKAKIMCDFFKHWVGLDKKMCEIQCDALKPNAPDIKNLQFKFTSAGNTTPKTFEEIEEEQQKKKRGFSGAGVKWPIDLKLDESRATRYLPEYTKLMLFNALAQSFAENPHFIFMKGEKNKQISLFEEINCEMTYQYNPQEFRNYFKANHKNITFCFEKRSGKEMQEGPASSHYRPYLEKNFTSDVAKKSSGGFTRLIRALFNLPLKFTTLSRPDSGGRAPAFWSQSKKGSKKLPVQPKKRDAIRATNHQSNSLGLVSHEIEILQKYKNDLKGFVEKPLGPDAAAIAQHQQKIDQTNLKILQSSSGRAFSDISQAQPASGVSSRAAGPTLTRVNPRAENVTVVAGAELVFSTEVPSRIAAEPQVSSIAITSPPPIKNLSVESLVAGVRRSSVAGVDPSAIVFAEALDVARNNEAASLAAHNTALVSPRPLQSRVVEAASRSEVLGTVSPRESEPSAKSSGPKLPEEDSPSDKMRPADSPHSPSTSPREIDAIEVLFTEKPVATSRTPRSSSSSSGGGITWA